MGVKIIMETKYHIKYPEEGDHIIECQQEELKRFFEKNKLWELKQDLWMIGYMPLNK